MNPGLWTPALLLVAIATVTDLWRRRIPNWLTLPAIAGGIIISAAVDGSPGLWRSLAGFALAACIFGVLCWLRSMGMGDLKLCAAVGSWIGPSPLVFALVVAAMAGGVIAVAYGLWKGRLASALDGAAALLSPEGLSRSRSGLHPAVTDAQAMAIPYAPAIAIGVLFSYFANQR